MKCIITYPPGLIPSEADCFYLAKAFTIAQFNLKTDELVLGGRKDEIEKVFAPDVIEGIEKLGFKVKFVEDKPIY